jgi:hypothetical protein
MLIEDVGEPTGDARRPWFGTPVIRGSARMPKCSIPQIGISGRGEPQRLGVVQDPFTKVCLEMRLVGEAIEKGMA